MYLTHCDKWLNIRKKNNLRKSGQALEQAAQGGGGVTSIGGVRELLRCGTEEHSLVGMVRMGWGWTR